MFQAPRPAPLQRRRAPDPVRFVMVVLQPGDAGLVPPTSIAEAEIAG